MSGGLSLTVALKSNGTVWAWGQFIGSAREENFYGQQLAGPGSHLSNIIDIDVGREFCVAVKNDGKVWGMGKEWLWRTGN